MRILCYWRTMNGSNLRLKFMVAESPQRMRTLHSYSSADVHSQEKHEPSCGWKRATRQAHHFAAPRMVTVRSDYYRTCMHGSRVPWPVVVHGCYRDNVHGCMHAQPNMPPRPCRPPSRRCPRRTSGTIMCWLTSGTWAWTSTGA